MKYITATLCTAAICAAIYYLTVTRPGRYRYERMWGESAIFDSATGKAYFLADRQFYVRNPVYELDMSERWKTKTGKIVDDPFKIPETNAPPTHSAQSIEFP
jgi:hypothetical protein